MNRRRPLQPLQAGSPGLALRLVLCAALPSFFTLLAVIGDPTSARAGVAEISEQQAAAQGDDPTARVASAIEALRGRTLRGLSEAERTSLFKWLDEQWSILMEHPRITKRVAREKLEAEQKDSFFIIELAYLLATLDEGLKSPGSMALYLQRVDPNEYPPAFFRLVSTMAVKRCRECIPVALKMLELETLADVIEMHALPVDVDLGLVFTLGHYGDAVIDQVAARLGSENCAVRRNASAALGFLQPAESPEALRTVASTDPCPEARGKAWETLGLLADPQTIDLAAARLRADPPPAAAEKLSIVLALGDLPWPHAKRLLTDLSEDFDPNVAATAIRTIQAREAEAVRVKTERRQPEPKPSGLYVDAHYSLRRAPRQGRFEYDGTDDDLLDALKLEDIPLINRARAAVLNRLSDECLHEYLELQRVEVRLRGRDGSAWRARQVK